MKVLNVGTVILVISLIVLSLSAFPVKVSADIPNPDFFSATCPPGERMVTCEWYRTTINGPTYGDCAKYQNDQNYRYLEGTGSTFGGKMKFCIGETSIVDSVVYHVSEFIPLLILAIILEVPVYYFLLDRKKRTLLAAAAANLVSYTLFYTVMVVLPIGGFIVIMLLEVAVVLFETVFLKFLLKDNNIVRLFFIASLANLVSLVLGYFIMLLLGVVL